MEADQISEARPIRTSETSRKQRDGFGFIGGYGTKTGDSDLLFIEGQLPEHGERVASNESPSRQLKLCLQSLETQLHRHGQELDNVLQLTLYLAEMDAYERVNETYERYFDETYPARTTVGVCELLGGAAVTVDAVIAVE